MCVRFIKLLPFLHAPFRTRKFQPKRIFCTKYLTNPYDVRPLCLGARAKKKNRGNAQSVEWRSICFLFATVLSTLRSAANWLTAIWCELRQTSTERGLTMYRVNSQGCLEDVAVHQRNLKSSTRQLSYQAVFQRSEISCFAFNHFLAELRSPNFHQIQPRQF